MTKDEALKLALEALEQLVRFESDLWELGSCRIAGQATRALREALAEQPAQQEPDRVKFERHWRKTRGEKKANRELPRHSLQPQTYIQDSANRHWVTWQAAVRSVAPLAQQEPVACRYGDNGYACCEGGPCAAEEHNNKTDWQERGMVAEAALAKLLDEKQEPVAVVSGYYGGQCVILPIDPARIFNSNTPLYASPPPQRKPLTDEREAFEAHWYSFYHSGSVSARSDGSYVHPHVQRAWEAWQARAAQE